jgi:hypothetical protein
MFNEWFGQISEKQLLWLIFLALGSIYCAIREGQDKNRK